VRRRILELRLGNLAAAAANKTLASIIEQSGHPAEEFLELR